MSASRHPGLAFPKHEPMPLAPGDPAAVTPEFRGRIMDRDGWRCRVPWCGSETFVELAHLKPLSLGGTTDRRNTAGICSQCHRAARASLHSGDLTWEFLSDRGADGPIRFTLFWWSMVSSPPGVAA